MKISQFPSTVICLQKVLLNSIRFKVVQMLAEKNIKNKIAALSSTMKLLLLLVSHLCFCFLFLFKLPITVFSCFDVTQQKEKQTGACVCVCVTKALVATKRVNWSKGCTLNLENYTSAFLVVVVFWGFYMGGPHIEPTKV